MPSMGIVFFALLAVVVLVVVGAAFMGLVVQLLWWGLIGLVIGALARLVVPGPRPLGVLATVLFGIAGALLGGILASALDVGWIIEFIIAVLVAAILIALFTGADRRRTATG
jgi:uncharacterized membrane protein YeaQ/YmgE (transglycosylase-associated protein family)